MPQEWRGKSIVAIIACHTSTPERARRDLAPLKESGGAIAGVLIEKTYIQQQAMLDTAQPKGNHYCWKSEYLSELPNDLPNAYAEQGTREASPLSQLVFFHIGGALNERKPGDGAVGNRDAAYAAIVAGGWAPNDTDRQAPHRLGAVRPGRAPAVSRRAGTT